VVILGFSGRIIYLSLLEGLNWFLLFKLHVYEIGSFSFGLGENHS
jgi:hypothetical protein